MHFSPGGLRTDREELCYCDRHRCPAGTTAEHLAQPESMNQGRLSGGGDIWTGAYRIVIVCQRSIEARKAVSCLCGQERPQKTEFCFGQSPCGGDFLVLFPSSSVPCYCTTTSHHVSNSYSLGGFQKHSHSGWDSGLRSAIYFLCDHWLITFPLWGGVSIKLEWPNWLMVVHICDCTRNL